ncbi:MAG TPA: energy transducer TonB [Burkholderiales bacterium]|nr:energy transducer TonB [Burkholderiales bacterium]
MSAAMPGGGRMRDGASRALYLAFAASVLLHAALIVVLPRVRELSALVPPEPQPLVAHLVEAPPPPAPPEEKPAPPPPRRAPPVAQPAPSPEPAPEPAPAPVLTPSPLGAPAPAPAREPSLAPAPAVASTPPAPPGPPPLDVSAIDRFRSGVTLQAAGYKRYPRVAIDNAWEGDVLVRMTIGEDGRIAALRVVRGSGYEVLDRQALEMFRNAKPRVAVPEALRGRRFELELRAVYSLRGN